MNGIVKSELLKMRHTFSLKMVYTAPLVTLLLGYLLSGNAVQLSAYNWWYIMIFPITIFILCASIITKERDTAFQNILCLPIHLEKIWLGKNLAITFLVFISNLLMWLGCNLFGIFTKMYISTLDGLIGCLLLFLTFLWQIPFTMFLANRMGYLSSILIPFAANVLLSNPFFSEKTFFS